MNFAGGATVNLNDLAGQYATKPAISAGTVATASSPINLYINNVPSGNGTMEIVKYSGNIGGSGSGTFNLAYPTNGTRSLYSLVESGGYLDLSYAVDYPYWTGAGNKSWDFQTTIGT